MNEGLQAVLRRNGYHLYPKSIRQLSDDASLFVAARDGEKLIGTAGDQQSLGLGIPTDVLDSGPRVEMHTLTWDVYVQLNKIISLCPSVCNSRASFGTGDRMGMVTAAHLDADIGYPVFPVIAQQSPRELERTGRTFKSVLLDAVMGVLESGWTAPWGADADHIKDESRFTEGIDAGYSMYTLDVSDDLQILDGLSRAELTTRAEALSDVSRKIVQDWAGKSLGGHTFSESELTDAAVIYEKSMQRVERFDSTAKGRLSDYDLEVSIDEGSRDTTPEDHVFVAEYLHRAGVDFKSLAPKFPGEFQKAVDYMGDFDELRQSFRIHAQLARKLQGYRLSLHSGSDKFSVYNMLAEATEGSFHVKTSGTSWLQAVRLIAHRDAALFSKLYGICLRALPESKKAYHVFITPDHFPVQPTDELPLFLSRPEVGQLFHISYGALLDARRVEIIRVLKGNEAEHYQFVIEHIERHLQLLTTAAER